MKREEKFIIFIKSLGFKYNYNSNIYEYKEFTIDICNGNIYNLYTGSVWYKYYPYENLEPINNYLKKELRTIKLKQILE